MPTKKPGDRARGASLLRWRGIMADMTGAARMASVALLILLACAMVATQTNYFVIGNTHLIAVLAPIATSALLFGPPTATLLGALAGLAEMLHALLLPLDAYEMYFVAPSNSVFLFALMGFFLGVMFSFAAHHPFQKTWQQVLTLLGICLAGSTLFTFLFSVSVNAINELVHLKIPREIVSDFTDNDEVGRQVLANFLLMVGLAIYGGTRNEKRVKQGTTRSLRETFQGWLAVVMVAAYLVSASFGYSAVSAACRAGAERQMQGQIDYLVGQLEQHDRLLSSIQRRTLINENKVNELHDSSISYVATRLPLGAGGVAAVAEDGTIVSSNVNSYLGRSFEDVVGEGLVTGFDETLFDQRRSVQWYMGDAGLGYLRAAQVGYIRVSQAGSYQVMAALPSSTVFAWRPWMMLAISVGFVILFTSIYLQASLLLKNVVVRGIDETNETLALITKGDLEQQVHVRDSTEFVSLSAGINATVSALKNAIAAEGARIERDLSTAKAIQESALPQTFPPFPDVTAFDIYANMSAAREVGGDFYDFFLIDDHTLGFLIADVSGKGIPASLFMMAAKTELANYMGSGMPLAEAVQTANWHLCQGNEAGMFVTVWAATLDYETGQLTYVNAGHNPPLLRHNGAWEWLRTKGGLFLGTFDTAKYRSTTTRLEQGDELLLYTDGVNEAFSASEEQYGDDRLEAFLQNHATLHPHQLVHELRDDLHAWAEGAEQSDDITMLALEFGTPPEASGSVTVPATLEHLKDVIDLVNGELAQRLCPIAVQNQINVALEELYVNVCNYAYAGADEPGSCQVSYVYHTNPNTMVVQLVDTGVPFDPVTQTDPTVPSSIEEAKIGGLGIMMTKRMTDDLSYLRDGNANVVAFKKSW